MDIRLYTTTGVYANTQHSSEALSGRALEDIPALGIEIIANKVVRFLLTTYGSDVLDPEYGAVAFTHTQMAESYIPKFTLELQDDVANCIKYVNASEAGKAEWEEKLQNISIVSIEYNTSTPSLLDVTLELLTTYNRTAILAIPRSI